MTSKDEAIRRAASSTLARRTSNDVANFDVRHFEEKLAQDGYKIVAVTEPAFHSGPRSDRS